MSDEASSAELTPAQQRLLDAALSRVLMPPTLPAGFHRQLQAALARAEQQTDRGAVRSRVEREQREQLAELEADYLRLRRRTLGTLIGGSFAAGAAVTLSMPWLQTNFGVHAPLVLAIAGAVVGLSITLRSWLPRNGLTDFT